MQDASSKQILGTAVPMLFFIIIGGWEETREHTLCDTFSVNDALQNCVME